MDGANILITFIAGLTVALALGYFAKRLNLSPIIGYLLAGIVVGPFTPGFSASYEVANQFADIGIILLLFGVGLRFELKELMTVWTIALPGALLQCTISAAITAVLLHFFGWGWASGFILGAAISVASTVVMALVLKEHHDLFSPIGHIAIGWAVVEDILTVVLLLLLPVFFEKNTDGGAIELVLGFTALKVIALLAIMIVLSRWIIPWILAKIDRTRTNELFTLGVIVLAIGIAVLAYAVFGVSMALGAFLAGLAVGRSDYALRAAGDSLPLKDVFSVLFFVSVGMLVSPMAIIETPLLIGIVLFVVLIVNPTVAALLIRLLGKPWNTAISVGAAFSQIGEFSFILGSVARGLGILDVSAWNALVVVSIVSIAVNPFIYRFAGRVAKNINRISLPEAEAEASGKKVDAKRCILIGYGPVGRIVHQLLSEQSYEVTVIEFNLDTVKRLRNHGYQAVYGDVLRQGVLEEAGIASAGTLIISADIKDAAEIITQSRKHNPQLRTLVRCANLHDAIAIKKAGATVVAAGEAEVGVALAEAIFDEKDSDTAGKAEKLVALRNRLYETVGNNGKPEAEKQKRESAMIFSAGLANGIVVTSLSAKNKEKAIRELVDKTATLAKVKNKEEFYRQVIEREEIANTYMDMGLAIPHARTNAVSGVVISLAISQKGIDWNAREGKHVHVIALLGAQKSYNEKYLQLLSRIMAVCNDPEFIERIKRCANGNDLISMVQEREKKILSQMAP